MPSDVCPDNDKSGLDLIGECPITENTSANRIQGRVCWRSKKASICHKEKEGIFLDFVYWLLKSSYINLTYISRTLIYFGTNFPYSDS